MPNITDNKRILKNTLFMYFRMLLLLIISLYCSRLILQSLGVDNYGIYNVVGGFVVLFSFINGAIATSTQRHLSIELGKVDGDISKVLSACINVHVIIAILILLFAETIGLWFLNTHMNFPEGRLVAANFVYQFSVFICLSNILQAPFNASVIAYEKMSFYAYLSILEAVLKLLIVCFLLVLPGDKLIFFSALQFILSVCVTICFIVYAIKKLKIRYVRIKDRKLYRYIFSFSGWTLFGSLATLLETQGLNILLNIFGGVTVNAAVGIANQVRGALAQFVNGFQQALNPQLVMSQSGGIKSRQLDLIYKSSKYSYFIFYIVAFPICIELDHLLRIWLTVVPNYTTIICVLVIIVQMIDSLSSPLYTTIFAIGKIRNYQIIVCVLRSLSIFLGYLICISGYEFYIVFLCPCFIALILFLYRIGFVRKEINLPISQYFSVVMRPIILVTLATAIPILCVFNLLPKDDDLLWLLLKCMIICVYVIACVFFIGMKRQERRVILNLIINRMK